MDGSILYEVNDLVAQVTLNRPQTRNALTSQMRRQLAVCLKQAGDDPEVRCVVLTGAGAAFCSGQDVKEMASWAADESTVDKILSSEYLPVIERIRAMPKPVIAAVNGSAAGAGCSLALVCDLRIAAAQASFQQAFVRLGLIPDCGANWMLPRLVGVGRAMEMFLTGRAVAADEAVQIGLVSQVVPGDKLAAVASAVAVQLAHGPTQAIGLTKRALQRAMDTDFGGSWEYESQLQAVAAQSSDSLEGVHAFLGKTAPRFQGL